jgi:hypothetical protein
MDRIVLDERGVIPWIDLAYLGFAQGWEADSEVARKIADRFDECSVWSLRLYALARRTPQIMAHQWFVQSWAIQN